MLGVYSWDEARFNALCRAANRTRQEIADMFCINPNVLMTYIEKDQFPPTVGLHLSNFETFITGSPMPVISPSHGN